MMESTTEGDTVRLMEPNKMTAEQLKAELKLYKLEVTGRKHALIERVTNHRKLLEDGAAPPENSDEEEEEEPMESEQLKKTDLALAESILNEEDQMDSDSDKLTTDAAAEGEEGNVKEEKEDETEVKTEEVPKEPEEPPPIDIVNPDYVTRFLGYGKLGYELQSLFKLNSLTAYPVTAKEMCEGFLADCLSKCCSYTLKMTPSSILKGKLGYLTMRFATREDFENAPELLKEWKPEIVVNSVADEKGTDMPVNAEYDNRSIHPGDRFVCVVGTPPSMTDTKLLELLPGYAATVCHNNTGDPTGRCFVEFATGELAAEALENLHKDPDNLVLDGQKFYAFQLQHLMSSPAEGGTLSKKDMMKTIYSTLNIRLRLIDNWAKSATIEELRDNIEAIGKAETALSEDSDLRRKYHLPCPDIWLSYIEQTMKPKLPSRPLGVRQLAALSVFELHARLAKREANKVTRMHRRAHKMKAIAYATARKENGESGDDESTERMVTTDGKPKPNIKVTVTDGTTSQQKITPGKKSPTKGNQKRTAGFNQDRGPINKKQRGNWSPRGIGRSTPSLLGRGGLMSQARGGGLMGQARGGGRGRGGRGDYSNAYGDYRGGYVENRGNEQRGYGYQQGGFGSSNRGYDAEPGFRGEPAGFGRNQGGYGRPNVQEKVMNIVQQLTDVLGTQDLPPRRPNYGGYY